VPVATQLLLQQQEDMDTYIMTQDEAAAEQFILQGMSTEELLRTMKKVFLEADTDNSGYLDEYEFKSIFGKMGLPLTAAQTSYLMEDVDVNKDGMIQYEEFIPVAFGLLVKVVAGTIKPKRRSAAKQGPPAPTGGYQAYRDMYASRDELPEVLQVQHDKPQIASLEAQVLVSQCRRIIRSKVKDMFAEFDTDRDGRLSISELAGVLGEGGARRFVALLDQDYDGAITQFEMRKGIDKAAAEAVQTGVAEYKFLQGVVEMLAGALS